MLAFFFLHFSIMFFTVSFSIFISIGLILFFKKLFLISAVASEVYCIHFSLSFFANPWKKNNVNFIICCFSFPSTYLYDLQVYLFFSALFSMKNDLAFFPVIKSTKMLLISYKKYASWKRWHQNRLFYLYFFICQKGVAYFFMIKFFFVNC